MAISGAACADIDRRRNTTAERHFVLNSMQLEPKASKSIVERIVR